VRRFSAPLPEILGRRWVSREDYEWMRVLVRGFACPLGRYGTRMADCDGADCPLEVYDLCVDYQYARAIVKGVARGTIRVV